MSNPTIFSETRAGIATEVVRADALDQEVNAVAQSLANGSTFAYAEAKRLLDRAVLPHLETRLENERQAVVRPGRSHHAREEGLTAFAEKQPPVFTGR